MKVCVCVVFLVRYNGDELVLSLRKVELEKFLKAKVGVTRDTSLVT